jgi:hypothetical protein
MRGGGAGWRSGRGRRLRWLGDRGGRSGGREGAEFLVRRGGGGDGFDVKYPRPRKEGRERRKGKG